MNRKTKVTETIHGLLPDETRRENYLRILLRVIKTSNSHGESKWGVQCRDNQIKVLIGSRIVFTIETERLWISLDRDLAEKHSSILADGKFWKWDTEDYPEYKQPPSRNGYYISPSLDAWGNIEPIHFAFLRTVSKKFKRLDIKSQPLHEPEVLNYLREALNEAVPVPLYDEDSSPCIPEEMGKEGGGFHEGAKKTITVNAYERDPKARRRCLEIYGTNCSVCGLNFEDIYGQLGKGFIHVHHLKQLSEVGEEYHVNPKEDLRPVCPNCHAMLHKEKTVLPIEKLKSIIDHQR